VNSSSTSGGGWLSCARFAGVLETSSACAAAVEAPTT
jgi:hypothetical protein